MTREEPVRPALAWCPCPDENAARSLANCLLDEGLIVCANVTAPMTSLFVWEGQREEAQETGVLMKTRADLLERLCERVEALHPYDTPVIVGWNVDRANKTACDWLAALGAPTLLDD